MHRRVDVSTFRDVEADACLVMNWLPSRTFIRLSRYLDFSPRPIRTLNGRLPVKLGSDRHETLPERVSNDFGRLIFRRQKKIFGENFGQKFLFFADLAWILTSYGEMDVKISFRVKFCSR